MTHGDTPASGTPRFEFRCPCDMGGYVDAERRHEPDGDYVEYADYAALERELQAANEKVDQQTAEYAELDREWREATQRASRLEVALKQIATGAMDDHDGFTYSEIYEVARAALKEDSQ